jgi:hypothetical protein
MSLETWCSNNWLTEHQTSREEVADLLAVVNRDLDDAAIERLSPDWRLGIAYNAALQLATLALAAAGYRPDRQRAHERAILSLQYTIGLDAETIATLDGVRRMRNRSNYERAGTASPSQAREVYSIAAELRERVVEWLRTNHPALV